MDLPRPCYGHLRNYCLFDHFCIGQCAQFRTLHNCSLSYGHFLGKILEWKMVRFMSSFILNWPHTNWVDKFSVLVPEKGPKSSCLQTNPNQSELKLGSNNSYTSQMVTIDHFSTQVRLTTSIDQFSTFSPIFFTCSEP